MKTKTRKLKIESVGDYAKKQTVPKIRIGGQWLRAAGFPEGSSVLCSVISPGVIEIRLEGMQAKSGEYLIAADRLDVALAKDKAAQKLAWIKTYRVSTCCTFDEAVAAWEKRGAK